MKTCTQCKELKPLAEFHKSGVRRGVVQLKTKCKVCRVPEMAEWERHNREKRRASHAAWNAKNRDKRRLVNRVSESRRRARKKENGTFAVTTADIRRLLREPCRASHLSPCAGDPTIDHIIPIARGGTHSVGNLQMLCAHHNFSKSDRLWVEFVSAA